jgi:hypothetical protein
MFLGLMILLLAVLIGATVRIFAVTRRIQAELSPDEFASSYKTHYLGMSAETPPARSRARNARAA